MKIKHLIVLAPLALLSCMQDLRERRPIALHPDNPHYFLYSDNPAVLITSGEHYGALLNLDFDYKTYFQTLAEDSLNLTRVFAGPYVEPAGAFNIARNTLAPTQERFICPWARSETPGYASGGNKFDLTKWDEQYFRRLHDMMGEANKRNIIVEFTLFCPFYNDAQWQISPMNASNNINGGGPEDRTHVYTLDKSNGLLAVHEALVRKIVTELKDYPNLIYEICNEPYFGGVMMDWQHRIADVIRDTEKDFEYQHLISQNIANGSQKIENPHAAVSVFNFHYATPPVAVAQNYHLNKVIGDNETGFKGNADSTYRKEGWAFIFAGGALYNNLDYSFTADHENGTFKYPETQPGGGSKELRRQLTYLRKFIGGFDFVRMKPDTTVVRNRQAVGKVNVIAEVGKQYGIYIFGKGPFALEIAVPSGTYTIEFIDPLTGSQERREPVTTEGILRFATPPFAEDVGVRIKSTEL